MKNYTLLIFINFVTFTTIFSQQQTPEFQFTLYIQDLQGNMDSVVIGYDPTATSNGLDSQFGEVDITNQPWKDFEVRVSPFGQLNQNLGKKQISNYYCNSQFYNFAEYLIIIKRDSSPVYITWDSNLFDNDCMDSSSIADNPSYFNYSMLDYRHANLKQSSIFTPAFNISSSANINHIVTTIDGSTDTAFVVPLWFADYLYTNTNEQKRIQQQTKAFPNPTTDKFTIQLPENYESESVQIFDITGREIYQNTEQNNQIEVPSSAWAKGVYFYRVELEDGLFVNGKIIKN